MPRAVLDTNVIVSGLITLSTPPYRILEKWRNGDFTLVTSPPALDELHRVLTRPKIIKLTKLSHSQIDVLVAHLAQRAYITACQLNIDVVKNDPDDNIFIACAIEGHADYLVSGDKHLLKIGKYENIKIVTPKAFLTLSNR